MVCVFANAVWGGVAVDHLGQAKTGVENPAPEKRYVLLTITGDSVNVRSTPSTSGRILRKSNIGDQFIAEATAVIDSEGAEWRQIVASTSVGEVSDLTAYVSAKYSRVSELPASLASKIPASSAPAAQMTTPVPDATTPETGEKFYVSGFSPQGLVSGPSNIRIDFSTPVVTSDDIGTYPERKAMPVVFSPEIEGQGVWISRGIFMYQLRNGYLPEATEFTATIPDGVKDASGKPISGNKTFQFNTAPLEFLGIRQTDYRMNEEVRYELSFSAPVNYNLLRSHIQIKDLHGRNVGFSIDNQSPSYNVLLRVHAGDGSPITLDIDAGLTSARGPLAMKTPIRVKIDRDLSLKITGSHATNYYYYESGTGIVINTTTEIDASRAESFVEITPKRNFTISARGSEFFITGDFPPRELITVRLKAGLPAFYGEGLAEDWERSFIFPDYEPTIEFATPGRFISPANEELLVPFTAVNLKKLDISVARVYDNNVSFVTKDGWPYYLYNEAEMIYENEFELSSEPNENYGFSIDLGKILNGRKGLFVIKAASTDYWPYTWRVVNVTDLAGSAKIGARSALIWANSISQGKPVKGVSVEIYSNSNQIIASGITDEHGVVSVKRDSDWASNLQPNTVILRKDGDVSVLRLEGNIWQTGNADYNGVPYSREKYVGFVYTPRGIFRPGETVPLRILVRNADLSPETPFPVQVKVYNSIGREWSTSTVITSELGMASADVRLGEAGPTGTWRAEVFIPGETIPIASRTFLVEDFAPPKIEVTVSSDQTELHRHDTATLDISAQYLFGAAGSELVYEVETKLIPREYSHPNWPDYSFFSNCRIDSAASNNIEAEGTLSKNGSATVTLSEITNRARSILDAVFTVGVREDGGRWVYKSLTIPYYPNDMMLGIKFSRASLSTNTRIPFGFAAIDTKGNAVNPEGVKLTVSREINRNIMTTQNGIRRSELRTETIPLEGFDKKPIIFERGTAAIDLAFQNYGTYIVSLEDEQKETYASVRFYVYDSRWYGGVDDATLPESLTIKLDRDIYKAGDKVLATVSGSFEGTVLFSVETDKVLYYDTSWNKGNSAEFSFDVTKDMMPNAWITAHLVRAAEPDDSWSAHRAFGATPLFVDCGELKLDVDVAAPERIRPGETNNFSVRLTDSGGRGTPGEFSIMLVDEGVLGLTNFQTPNYYENYTIRRALSLNAYDIYTELMPLYLKTPPVLTAGGGDDYAMLSTLKASMSPVRANRFRILAVLMDVKTDSNGTANVAMEVPEFSGRARLMTVASSKGAFGASEKSFTIARDVVADVTLPRVLAPGDTFRSEIQLFNRTADSIATTVTLKIDGPVSIVSVAEKQVADTPDEKKSYTNKVSVPANEGAFSIPLTLQADDEYGVVTVTLAAQYGEIVLSQDIELTVRPPYPRVTTTGAVTLKPKDTAAIVLPSDWFPGTRRAMVSMSGMPSISLADIARFLLEYPYSCTEQTVSRGWVLLAASDIASQIDPRLTGRHMVNDELSRVIRRIQSVQLYNGSFSPWEMTVGSQWVSVYATHFLVTCENEGIDVPRETLNNALEYLRFLMAEVPDSFDKESYGAALATRAYIAYVLTQKGESPLAWMSYLRNNLSAMPDYGRLLLAAAYASSDKKTAVSITGNEAPSMAVSAGSERPNLDSPLRTRALRLLALIEIDPTSSETAAVAANLLTSLREVQYYTTQETGWALLSLSRFFSHNPVKGEAALVMSSATDELLAETDGNNAVNLSIPAEIEALQVENKGTAIGYAIWTVDGIPTKPPTPINNGMNITVRYFNSEGFEIQDGAFVKNGERVTGKIIIRPFGETLKNIVVVLPLAGGLEIENPKISQQSDYSSENYDDYYATVKTESRDDRLLLFVDHVEKEFSWAFSMRAITSGTFIVPPIAAEGMYSPGIRSVGATSRVTIQ